MPVEIHVPDSFHVSLSREKFDVEKFMGKWHVVYSSLPLWKNKKDVTITYTPVEEKSSPTSLLRFWDLVEYRAGSASSATSKPSRIEGIDTLLPAPPNAPSNFTPGTSYKWRGKGILIIASSKWQVLGYDNNWAVTFFAKTLLTPAGIDIYSRDEKGLSQVLYDEIVQKMLAVGGEVGNLAKELFEVKRGD